MKKTISINIGGIIFHIEEDGYEKLKSYLESVNKYFSTFEDSAEIISDIESRIAELFLAKLSDGRQTLYLEDVNELIQTMGTTKDFQESIDPEEAAPKSEQAAPEAKEEAKAGPSGPKKLYRDTKRKILGGVASGIAHYFGIDPLWIRLIIVALFINVIFVGLSTATFLAYIICWIVIPPNEELEEDKKVKKLFRDSEHRVLGGVSSGIAAYFGIDIAVVRLLFVLSLFLGGAGFLVYIVLWIITPEAKTITQKMEMQGEPVTLSNIEENVKKGLNVKEGEESALVKVLLFPFRLIAVVITGIGKLLGPILSFASDLIRILFGTLLMIIGLAIMIGLILVLLTLSGYGPLYPLVESNILPLDLIQRSLETWAFVSIFLVVFIPVLAISMLGLVVILKRRVANAYVGWSLFAIWIAALIATSLMVPNYAREFKTEGNHHYIQNFEVTQGTPTFYLSEKDDVDYDGVELRIRAHQDSIFQLSVMVESRGKSREDAINNAKMATYRVERKAEDFYFDPELSFPDSSRFRFQTAEVTFYVPYGKVFRMDAGLEEILINTLHVNGYRSYQMEGNDWAFDENGINCLTCSDASSDTTDTDGEPIIHDYSGKDEMTFPFDGFDEVKVSALLDVEIRQGEEYSVKVKGESADLDEVYLNQVGDELEVRFMEDNWKWWLDNNGNRLALIITMPELSYLSMAGACKGEVSGFEGSELTVELVGASELYMNVNATKLDVSLAGASEMDLRGSGERLDVELVGASDFNSLDFNTNRVYVDAVGASKATVFGSEEINISAVGVSNVRYKGARDVTIDSDGLSSVREY